MSQNHRLFLKQKPNPTEQTPSELHYTGSGRCPASARRLRAKESTSSSLDLSLVHELLLGATNYHRPGIVH
jgi:hypothetical protein